MVKILEIIQKPPGPILLSLLVVIIFYCLAVSARNGSGNGERWSPVALTAGVSGRGSLANLQVFFFTLVVVWLAVFWLIKDHSLIDLSGDVLILLGISAAGTGGAKITAAARKKLSLGNMSWLRKKGWIKENLDKTSGPPGWSDLLNEQGQFDVSKFQMLAFSLVVGVSLLIDGTMGKTANFEIPDTFLTLLGLSQAVYVGGKAIGPTTIADLDDKLSKLRELEAKFIAEVVKAWQENEPDERDLETAKAAAPNTYNTYFLAAEEAALAVKERIGGTHDGAKLEPTLPR